MRSRRIDFLSGLPRSGSTLLASILSQNPEVSVSPSSPLVGVLRAAETTWESAEHIKASIVPGQKERVLRAIIEGFYDHEEKPVLIDKNRAWANPPMQEMAQRILGRPPKIIATVRPIAEILASFINLVNKNPGTVSFIDQELMKRGQALTTENRCKALMGPEGHVYQSWHVLKMGMEKYPQNIHIVEYEMLVLQPLIEMARIYKFLNLPEFTHNFAEIKNKAPEDDTAAYGLPGMHTIRPYLLKRSPDPKEVLGPGLFHFYQGGEFWSKI